MREEDAQLFRALGDPVRWALLRHLAAADGEVGASELADVVPVSQPTLSYHLALLRDAGLLEQRKEGRQRFYLIRAGKVRQFADFLETNLLGEHRAHDQATA